MINPDLRRYLEENQAQFTAQALEPRPTSQEVAHVAHISGKRLAKTVLLRERDAPDRHVMAVVPASELVDLPRLSRQWGRPLVLAPEEDLTRLLPQFEAGAAPPFEGLTGLKTIVDDCLAGRDSIAFFGGTRGDLVEMPWSEFLRLAQPEMFSELGRPWP